MSAKSKIVGLVGLAAASIGALAVATSAGAYDVGHDTRVLVVNSTNHTLTNLYASRASDPRFHGDWLGSDELAPGQSMVIDFDDGANSCLMDVKGVFSDNTYVQRRFDV